MDFADGLFNFGRITTETNREIIENPNKPLGHGFVIKMMLEGLL